MLQKLTFLLKLTLGISFLCLFTYSIVKLAQRRVGNKSYIDTTSSSYPTITICPCPYNHKVVDPIHLQMNFTVEDVMNLPSIKENTQALMVVSSTYMPQSE